MPNCVYVYIIVDISPLPDSNRAFDVDLSKLRQAFVLFFMKNCVMLWPSENWNGPRSKLLLPHGHFDHNPLNLLAFCFRNI